MAASGGMFVCVLIVRSTVLCHCALDRRDVHASQLLYVVLGHSYTLTSGSVPRRQRTPRQTRLLPASPFAQQLHRLSSACSSRRAQRAI